MSAQQRCQFELMTVTERKPYNLAALVEMHPFCLRHLPRRGRFALHSAFELISTLKHSAAKTSPSGGSPRRGIGVHFRRAAGVVVWFSIPRSDYKTHCPKGDTITL